MRSLVVAVLLGSIVASTSIASAADLSWESNLHSGSRSLLCDLVATLCACNLPPQATLEPSPVTQIEDCL
jgi:hypothetical protein